MGTVLAVIGYVLLGLLALLLLLPLLPVYVRLRYREHLRLRIYLAGIPVFRYTASEQEEAPSPPTDIPKKTKKPAGEAKESPLAAISKRLREDGVAAVLSYAKSLATIAGGAIKRVLASLVVDKLCLQIYVASGDASETAQTVGKVCAGVYPALATIQSVVRIRRQAVEVIPDYLADKGRVDGEVLVHAIPYRLLWAALIAFIQYRKVENTRNTTTQRGIPQEEEQHG